MAQDSMANTLTFDQFVDQPFQTTVRDRMTFDGIGLHSGRFAEVSICPAPANTGIKFRRIDVDAKLQTVEAHAKYAEPRCGTAITLHHNARRSHSACVSPFGFSLTFVASWSFLLTID